MGLRRGGGKGKVLFDLHAGAAVPVMGSWCDATCGALMPPRRGDVHAVDDDLAAVHRPDAGDAAFGMVDRARTIAADDGG